MGEGFKAPPSWLILGISAKRRQGPALLLIKTSKNGTKGHPGRISHFSSKDVVPLWRSNKISQLFTPFLPLSFYWVSPGKGTGLFPSGSLRKRNFFGESLPGALFFFFSFFPSTPKDVTLCGLCRVSWKHPALLSQLGESQPDPTATGSCLPKKGHRKGTRQWDKPGSLVAPQTDISEEKGPHRLSLNLHRVGHLGISPWPSSEQPPAIPGLSHLQHPPPGSHSSPAALSPVKYAG